MKRCRSKDANRILVRASTGRYIIVLSSRFDWIPSPLTQGSRSLHRFSFGVMLPIHFHGFFSHELQQSTNQPTDTNTKRQRKTIYSCIESQENNS